MEDVCAINEWEELMGKNVKRKIVSPGEDPMASYGNVVVCNLRCYAFCEKTDENDSGLELREELRNERYQIGESDTIPGLELVLRFAKKNGHYRAQVASNYGYGITGKVVGKNNEFIINSNSDLEFDIEVVDIIDVDSIDVLSPIPPDSTIPKSAVFRLGLRRECGNRWFNCHEYKKAASNYSKAITLVEALIDGIRGKVVPSQSGILTFSNISDDEKTIFDGYISCLNNLCSCCFMLKEYSKAEDVCVQVLTIDPFNIKAILRAGRVSLNLSEYETCKACIDKIRTVLDIYRDHSSSEKDKNESSSTLYSFGKLSSSDIEKFSKETQELEVKLKTSILSYKQRTKKVAKIISKSLFSLDEKGNKGTPEESVEIEKPKESLIETKDGTTSDESKHAENKSQSTDEGTEDGNEGHAQQKVEKKGQPKVANGTLNHFVLMFTSVLAVGVSFLLVLFFNNWKS